MIPIDYTSGPLPPLIAIEPQIYELVLQMTKHRIPLRAGQGTLMVNSAIEGTKSQQALIDFKLRINVKQHADDLGTVGAQYWDSFM